VAGPVTELLGASALEVGAAIRASEVSATEVLELHLERIAEVNPRLNAIVTLCEDDARAAAAAADLATERGPLHGVPFTVKDSIATAGVRSTAGSRLLSDFVPKRDATAVARLKRAGAVLLGKANCPEFALDPITDNRLFGLTLNPVDEKVTVGGSSGGDAAAVASNCAVFGIGSDYGGSIRWPAQCAGIVGMRPTVGLVPGTGGLPFPPGEGMSTPSSVAILSRLQTFGPLARSVDDLWAILEVLAGPDGIDPNTVPVSLSDPDAVEVSGLRVAWTDGEGAEPVHQDLVAAVERAATALEVMGLDVEQRRPTGLERAVGIFRLYRAADGLPVHMEVVRGREDELAETMKMWSAAVQTPATVAQYQRFAASRDEVRTQVLAFMEEHPIVLMPVSRWPAFPLGSLDFAERFLNMAPCSAITLLGLPVVVVRAGTTSEGLPAGVQIVGRPFADHEVLAVARRLEDAQLADAPRQR
jgi:Asp-tRNA(Asn)/Glu-tRNA(Gln) amidotransferase A subunit family amidase